MGFSNMSAYIRKMAIDGYYIKVDFSEIHEKKIIADMKAEHEKVLKTVKDYFDKLLEIM